MLEHTLHGFSVGMIKCSLTRFLFGHVIKEIVHANPCTAAGLLRYPLCAEVSGPDSLKDGVTFCSYRSDIAHPSQSVMCVTNCTTSQTAS